MNNDVLIVATQSTQSHLSALKAEALYLQLFQDIADVQAKLDSWTTEEMSSQVTALTTILESQAEIKKGYYWNPEEIQPSTKAKIEANSAYGKLATTWDEIADMDDAQTANVQVTAVAPTTPYVCDNDIEFMYQHCVSPLFTQNPCSEIGIEQASTEVTINVQKGRTHGGGAFVVDPELREIIRASIVATGPLSISARYYSPTTPVVEIEKETNVVRINTSLV